MTLPDASPDRKILALGTALWGWGVDRETAYSMLERFLHLGGRIVDTATNYPINKRSEDFGLAVSWISDWIALNGAKECAVLIKVGATDNMGGAAVNLQPANILGHAANFRERLGDALAALAIHWDNRDGGEDSPDDIAETLDAMLRLHASGLSVGFSGVRRPDLYLRSAPALSGEWWIQVKENALSNTARLQYQNYFPKARYLAYGVNMGGLKNEPVSEDSSLALRGVKHPDDLVERLSKFIDSDHGLPAGAKKFQ